MKTTAVHRLQAVLGLLYIVAGGAKLAAADLMVEAFDLIGLGQRLRVVVGMVEIVGGLCLLIPSTSVYAGLVLACTIVAMLGATIGHVARASADRQSFDVPHLTTTRTWTSI